MSSKLRVIVTGYLAQYPMGGVSWDYLQYVTGLAELGHDVYYIEDTGQWPYFPGDDGLTKDCVRNVAYLSDLMARYGLEKRWAYRFPWESQWFGMAASVRDEVIRTADVLLNVSGTLERPEEYRDVARLVYIDSDPVFTQVKLAKGHDHFRKLIDAHDVTFSFGECPTDATPKTGHRWLPTRQPIVLGDWRVGRPHRGVFTTVMNWSAHKPIQWEGRQYGQKDLEFPRFMELPARVPSSKFELAANPGKGHRLPKRALEDVGWSVVHPNDVCGGFSEYRDYLETSKGEWSVAKHGYVVGQSGWFSCRSACYLAAGRPVVVQDTGFSRVLPTGEGLLAFDDLDGAVAGILAVESDHERHGRAARALAEEYFDSKKVLTRLLDTALGGDVA